MSYLRNLYVSILFLASFILCALSISDKVIAQTPDLTITEINAPSFVSTQHPVNVSCVVNDQGNRNAISHPERWKYYDVLYLSVDDTLMIQIHTLVHITDTKCYHQGRVT